jgi:hypothetical protein
LGNGEPLPPCLSLDMQALVAKKYPSAKVPLILWEVFMARVEPISGCRFPKTRPFARGFSLLLASDNRIRGANAIESLSEQAISWTLPSGRDAETIAPN